VEAGRVYLLSGYVGFEDIPDESRCNLQIVFRDADAEIVQFIDYPSHVGTRDFELDFPIDLKVRAPEDAVSAEVNLVLQGAGAARFDDVHFGPAPVGTIEGRVTSGGSPLEGTRVSIYKKPWGIPYEAKSDSDGNYTIADVPVAFPRYILIASREGYRSRSWGRIQVKEGESVAVDFDLAPGRDPLDDLRVKSATLELARYVAPNELSEAAEIPADASGYPASVRVYLEPSESITSDHPEVVGLANTILSTVEDKSSTKEVAWAVYEWISRNIEHDGVYSIAGAGGMNQPFLDVTSGIWQTIAPDGWCWGRNFDDWTYKPHELIETRGGICVEHALLGSALLRALNIPARPFSGSLEFYAQTPDGAGSWHAMSTTAGRTFFREQGELGPGFARGRLKSFPITAGSMMHEDWNAENRGLWRERHPWSESYPGTESGLEQALADMETFRLTGEAPPGQHVTPGQDHYVIHYRDITINLYDMGNQRELDTRFPLVPDTDLHEPQNVEAYWTNHPECVTGTRVEITENPPVNGTEGWFHVTFDLSSLID
jgi:hypothetical protein